MVRKKIMVVDDEEHLLKIIGTRLEKSGFDVITVCESKTVLERAKAERPDLLILDIMMPELNGVELGHQLRQDPITREMPVIFLTALMKREEIDVAGRGSSRPVLAKPFDSAELLREISQALQ